MVVLQNNLRIQDARLKESLSSIGLENPTYQQLRQCLEAKFPDTHELMLSLIQHMDDKIKIMLQDLEMVLHKPHWPEQALDRVLWEWHFIKGSLNAKRHHRLVQDFQKWNDHLDHLISTPRQMHHDVHFYQCFYILVC
ncbi:hypothetical protein CDD81_1635 [Ophiocordyceps australis]|uniref:Uncharacterized protein n=1 Tax=Ophiocordyceps australis TaxID=1399860 RepID=A0A2C5XZA3_9HYPO|nr:hypothetical protein CDD81_1635 [Ophiocordyceps australis]